MLDGDDHHFNGKAMRLGGLSMAINAKVPESILFLQSGHWKAKAARGYMIPKDPSLQYTTGEAILEALGRCMVGYLCSFGTRRTDLRPSVTQAGV
jgi:hypothetical protein